MMEDGDDFDIDDLLSNIDTQNVAELGFNPVPSDGQAADGLFDEMFPQPPVQVAHSSTDLINSLLQRQIRQNDQIRILRDQQVLLFQAPKREVFDALYADEKLLHATIKEELQELDMLNQRVILTPGELHRVFYLQNEFKIQLQQVRLFIVEIEQLVSHRSTNPIASLVIARQPFPEVPSKNHQLSDGELVVQLLTAANTQVVHCSPVTATIIIENTQGRSEQSAISNETQPLDSTQHKAKFPLVFQEGTRKNAAEIRFSVDLQVLQSGQQMNCTLESTENSAPFVVMTNQKQFEGCERTLLFRDAFRGQLEVPWCQFANVLQRQFIRATKQDPQNPTRCLSKYDLTYLHDKFLAKHPVFPQREYENFWSWYGKCVQVLRYQRHVSQLWQEGLLYGFITREEVDMALSDTEPGTFILRFSERHAGQIGIAYVGNQVNEIKHYLVQPNDTAAAKFTLPDFLRDKPQFRFMLRFTLLPSNEPQFIPVPKDQAMESMYSRRAGGDTSGSGYDPLT